MRYGHWGWIGALALIGVAGLYSWSQMRQTGGGAVDPAGSTAIDVAGHRLQIALPEHFCAYPDAAVKQLGTVMEGLHILLAAGDCDDLARTAKSGIAVPTRSTILALQDRDLDPANRPDKGAFLQSCLDEFPSQKKPEDLVKAVDDFNAAGTGVSIGDTLPLGVLRASPDSILGGSMDVITTGQQKLIHFQVTACLVPASIPLIWLFQVTAEPDSDAAKRNALLENLIDLAQTQVARTSALNPL